MSGGQWFTFWMTLMQTIGGGVVTLAGVGAGFLFARGSERRKRWQDDVAFWLEELSKAYQELDTAWPGAGVHRLIDRSETRGRASLGA